MSRTLTLTPAWYAGLPEKRQVAWATKLAGLCTPLEEASRLRGLLEETDSYTITVSAKNTPIAFRIGDLACPAEEDPSTVGGRRRSRVKKQTRRTQRKRRNTIRKKL